MANLRANSIVGVASTNSGVTFEGPIKIKTQNYFYLPTGNTFKRNVIENVVEDGLVLYLDAGTSTSYSGTGNTWTDLSGNNNTGTLTNGPTYNSANGGSIVLDGVNDYVSVSNSTTLNPASAITVSAFFKISSFGGNYAPIIFKKNNYTSFFEQYALYLTNTAVGFVVTGANRVQVVASSNVDYRNAFVYAVGTCDIGSQQVKLYINGNLITTLSFTSTFDISTNPVIIGANLTAFSGFCTGNIYTASVYNRALSAAEVSQNFNALRSRYGI